MYREKVGDIFEDVALRYNDDGDVRYDAPDGVIYGQCISADLAMGAGIATKFNYYFNTKNELLKYNKECLDIGLDVNFELCQYYYIKPVINFITKEKYWHKPTKEDFEIALNYLPEAMTRINISGKIKEIRVPMLGTGLDKLPWSFVKPILQRLANELEESGVDLVVIDPKLKEMV